MAKDKAKPKQRSSGIDSSRAAAAPVSELDDSDKRVRGKPVSLHPLKFRDALRLLINTPPPNKRYKTETPLKAPPKKRGT